MPALLTSTSMRPSSARTLSTMRVRSERFVTSVGSASAFRPRLRTSFAVRSALSAFSSATTTSAPRRASSSAVARPMPWPPPVTMATRPPSSLPSRRLTVPEYTAARGPVPRAMVGWTPEDRGRRRGPRRPTLRRQRARALSLRAHRGLSRPARRAPVPRRAVQSDVLPRGRRPRVRPAPQAARQAAAVRARRRPRVPRAGRARRAHDGAGAEAVSALRGRRGHRHDVLRDGLRARPHLPRRQPRRRDARRAPRDLRVDERRARAPAPRRLEGGRPRRVRTPRRLLRAARSEEHTSELQSRSDLVCRLLLEKKQQTARRRRRTSDNAML